MSNLPGNFDDLPPRLRDDLRHLHQPPIPFPASRDAALLAAARAAGNASRARRWRFAIGSGLAAAVALAATLWWAQTAGHNAPHPASYVRTGDIRDAFFLARQLQHPPASTLDAAWDANHDGHIDQSDVQTLALAAVHLNGGSTP